jgi:hypothetical protein
MIGQRNESDLPLVRYPDPGIKILDPRFSALVLGNAAIERIAGGYRFTEGPVWFGDGRFLLWSDIPNDRILKWEEETGAVSLFRKPSHYANCNTRDRQGRLVTCEMDAPRLTRTAVAIAGAVQWVAACGGVWLVSAPTRSTVAAGSGGIRDGRVLSRVNPATPSGMKRACQRQTPVLSLPRKAGNCVGAVGIRRQQDDPGAPDVLLRAVTVPYDRFQPHAITRCHRHGYSFAHRAASHQSDAA